MAAAPAAAPALPASESAPASASASAPAPAPASVSAQRADEWATPSTRTYPLSVATYQSWRDLQRPPFHHSAGRHDNPPIKNAFEAANNLQKFPPQERSGGPNVQDRGWQRDRPGKHTETPRSSSVLEPRQQQQRPQGRQQHDAFNAPAGARAQQQPPRNGEFYHNNHNANNNYNNRPPLRHPGPVHQDGAKGFNAPLNPTSQLPPRSNIATPAAQQPYNPSHGQGYSRPSSDPYYQAPVVSAPYQKPNYAYQTQSNAPHATGAFQPAPSHVQHQSPVMTDPNYPRNPTPQYQTTAAAPTTDLGYPPGYQQPRATAAPYPPTHPGYYSPPTTGQQQRPGGPYQSTTNYPTYR
ncbi:hypothetical protein BGX20_011513 [Mortierella sp. AD010]|nr:hypothetical protein BGX20_011513 [Mortierella sp. AD010]